MSEWLERTCPECGKSFYVERETSRKRFCSSECGRRKWGREHYRPVKHETRKCKLCGHEFTPTRRDNRYCSRYCANTAYRLRKVTDKDEVREQAHRFIDECYEAAKVAVSALSDVQVAELRWLVSTNCSESKALRMWLEGEDSDNQGLKRIRERMR